jgi:hypothetical protein
VRKVLVETSNKSESFIFKNNKQGDSKEVSFLLNCPMFFFFNLVLAKFVMLFALGFLEN